SWFIVFIFFFQAEDGIRDYKVTGVQTCALPISNNNNITFFLFLYAKYSVISSYNSFISLFLGPLSIYPLLRVHVIPSIIRKHYRSEEHTSELQSPCNIVCSLLLEKKNYI